MTTSDAGPRGLSRRRRLTLLLTAAMLLAPATATAATSHAGHGKLAASAASTQPRALMSAARAARQADRALVSDAKKLQRCRRLHPARCASEKAALQRAGKTDAARQRRLSKLAGSMSAKSSSWYSYREAPKLTVSGQTLSWNRIPYASTYVVVRHVPGQAEQDTVVDGTSYTPPSVPGATVRYSVRSTALGAAWSNEVSISYPKPAETKPSEPEAPKPTVTLAAPALSVSGQTLSWSAITGVSAYVLDTKVPGKAEQFTEVSGTSYTPTAVPGTTVHYSVRTAVEGSAWSAEVSISYASEKQAEPAPTSSETPPAETVSAAFQPGINSGSAALWELPGAVKLGAKVVRIGFEVNEPVSRMESIIAGYAADGIRVAPLAEFYGRLPSSAEAVDVAAWAKAFGPGGTFWANHTGGQYAIKTIEFGNETSLSYQYSNDTASGYASRAQTYAERFAEAAEAVKAANASVGMLAQGDPGNSGTIWVENMFKAVPKLASLVAGWTVHPYGNKWRAKLEEVISQTAAQGAPSSIPIDITEWGLSTDNGVCVTENYGWNPCMSYEEAAQVLDQTVSEMHTMLGSRMGLMLLYKIRDEKPAGTTDEREAYFGALQSELQTKGAYTSAVMSFLAS